MRRPKEKALTGRALNQLQDINETIFNKLLKSAFANSNRQPPRPQVLRRGRL